MFRKLVSKNVHHGGKGDKCKYLPECRKVTSEIEKMREKAIDAIIILANFTRQKWGVNVVPEKNAKNAKEYFLEITRLDKYEPQEESKKKMMKKIIKRIRNRMAFDRYIILDPYNFNNDHLF